MADADRATPARTAPLPNEEALVERAVDGDRTAFTRLVEHYQSACYGLAWRLLGDPDLAADATQDAFVHAYGAIDSYRGGLFRSWMMRITANASYDILRRSQRRPAAPLPEPSEGEVELPDTGAPDPIAEAERSELYRHLDVALRLLPEDQRVAVTLCDVYQLDYEEIAQMTDTPVGTVKSRIHRGRLRLRALLLPHRELFGAQERPAE